MYYEIFLFACTYKNVLSPKHINIKCHTNYIFYVGIFVRPKWPYGPFSKNVVNGDVANGLGVNWSLNYNGYKVHFISRFTSLN